MPDASYRHRSMMVIGAGPKHLVNPGPAVFENSALQANIRFVMDRLILSGPTQLAFRVDSVEFNDSKVELIPSPLEASIQSLGFAVKQVLGPGDVLRVHATNISDTPIEFVACVVGDVVSPDNVSVLHASLGHAYDAVRGATVCNCDETPERLAVQDLEAHGIMHVKCPTCLLRLIDREEETLRLLRIRLECFGKAPGSPPPPTPLDILRKGIEDIITIYANCEDTYGIFGRLQNLLNRT